MSRLPEAIRAGDRHAVESGLRHRIGFRLVAGYLSVLLLLGVAWAVAASGANALRVRFSHTVQIEDALAATLSKNGITKEHFVRELRRATREGRAV